MKIINDTKLDFSDVLIVPQRSSLTSRKQVEIEREFKFKHAKSRWRGVPIIAANMDTIGTFEMFAALSKHKIMTALHKHHSVDDLLGHYMAGTEPECSLRYANELALGDICYGECDGSDDDPTPYVPYEISGFTRTLASKLSFYSMGTNAADFAKFKEVYDTISELCYEFGEPNSSPNVAHPIKMVCVDVANGYTDSFVEYIKVLRAAYPYLVIMAGNVVTPNMAEQVILAGADIAKIGIGQGSACTTRKMTGVGYPQLSAIVECADAVHNLGGLLCSDGGCTVPGDVAKAFGAGADFVMLGGMLSGHDECAGAVISEWTKSNIVLVDNGEDLGCLDIEHKYKEFYGMSSATAMRKYAGGVAEYRASEGKAVRVPYRGKVTTTVTEILGGLRSTCTYVGAAKLEQLSDRTTFIKVNNQLNEIFGKS